MSDRCYKQGAARHDRHTRTARDANNNPQISPGHPPGHTTHTNGARRTTRGSDELQWPKQEPENTNPSSRTCANKSTTAPSPPVSGCPANPASCSSTDCPATPCAKQSDAWPATV